MATNGTVQSKLCSALDTRSVTANTHLGTSGVGSHFSGVLLRGNIVSAVAAGEFTCEVSWLCTVEEADGALSKHVPERGGGKETCRHAAPKTKRTGLSALEMDHGEGWNHVIRGWFS